MHKAIAKLKQNNFIVARFSPYDFREILCINKSLIRLTFRQKVRLYLIHPFLRNMIFFHTVVRDLFNAHK
ncbi:MAG: hypothetical protein JWR23_3024 [Mucilaginibacter sp.]|nr:hypothetical protein [Mucilaginibacter sp.]